ncbi:MAG TPA: M56 family metallopeptidase [Candidatus Baltobacteraceae bacterium]|nr:M56 family metallopeptidase [Candidatus Baltobacteraceae bacterium]
MIQAARVLLDVLAAALWQDAIIALFAAALLWIGGRRVNASTRQFVMQSALLVMLILPVATTAPRIASSGAKMPAQISLSPQGPAVTVTTRSSLDPRRIDVVLNDGAVLSLACAWALGAGLLLLRVGAGFLRVASVLHRSSRLRDYEGVRVYATTAVGVPFSVGFIAPSIVVPQSLLGTAEFHSAIMHELAHVRRHDAWAHTLEQFARALLFFNPAAVFVLGALALEREAACDDWVVAQSGDEESYTRALAVLALQECGGSPMPAVCGAIGFGHALVKRIERLQDVRRNRTLALSQYAVGGSIAVLVISAFVLQSFAPAIAFSSPAPAAHKAATAAVCWRDPYVVYAAPPQGSLPSGRVSIDATISPAGKVVGARIAHSSGNARLDSGAIAAVKNSSFAPAIRNCKPVQGNYLFLLTTNGSKE